MFIPLSGVTNTGAAPFTITSSDPARLLLSDVAGQAGRESIQPRGQFFAQALGDSGVASVTLSHPYLTNSTASFSLTPSALAHRLNANYGILTVQGSWEPTAPFVAVAGGTAQLELNFGVTDGNGYSQFFGVPRSGVSSTVRLVVVPAGVLELSASEYTVGVSQPIRVVAKQAGVAKIVVTAVGPIPLLANSREIPFEVVPPR
jgi:hypothetical protein